MTGTRHGLEIFRQFGKRVKAKVQRGLNAQGKKRVRGGSLFSRSILKRFTTNRNLDLSTNALKLQSNKFASTFEFF